MQHFLDDAWGGGLADVVKCSAVNREAYDCQQRVAHGQVTPIISLCEWQAPFTNGDRERSNNLALTWRQILKFQQIQDCYI